MERQNDEDDNDDDDESQKGIRTNKNATVNPSVDRTAANTTIKFIFKTFDR